MNDIPTNTLCRCPGCDEEVRSLRTQIKALEEYRQAAEAYICLPGVPTNGITPWERIKRARDEIKRLNDEQKK